MRRIFILLFLVSLLIGGMPAFGEKTLEFDPDTGDAEFDATLGALNVEVKGNLSEFITNLSVSYNVPEEEIEPLITEEEMTPADAYMALEIADIIDEPVDTVVEEYKANKGKGWGVIAKQLGIKPGSEEFHALKAAGAGELKKAKNKSKAASEKTKGKSKEKDKKPDKEKKDKKPKNKK